ncbi:MAG: efflux RND transporter periplasmic adaptor subunit [Armatimonadota bacterium]|nr:efflux RND transporter periplasmic adaptor subunit [Armatimonadota bacterium]
MRRWWVAGVVMVLVAASALTLARRRSDQSAAPPMRTAPVTRGTVTVTVTGTGTVEPAALVEVRSRATGRVTRVVVDEGQPVRRGQVLVELDDPDARAAAEAARAALQSALAAEASARARLAQLRAGPSAAEIAQAAEAVAQAEATLARARDTLARQERLLAEGYVAQAVVDQARAEVEIAASQLRAARARLADLRATPRPEDVAQAEAAVRQAAAQVQQVRATLRQAEERLGETRITAPIDGVVVQKAVDVGQTVIGGGGVGGTLVIVLARVDPLYATVYVDEADVAGIRPGMPVTLTADALPEQAVRGRVVRIAARAVVNQNVTQFAVKVALEDPPPALRLGMTVDAEFVVARAADVLVVPREAVRGTTVTVVRNGRLEPRRVRAGLSDGRLVEVREGLAEGEVVFLGYGRPQSPEVQGRSPFTPQFGPRQAPGGSRR